MHHRPSLKKTLAGLGALFLGTLLATPGHAQRAAGADAERIVAGRILVMPRAGLPDARLDQILRENGAQGAGRRVGRSELRIVNVPPGQERQVVARLARHPHLKFAEPDQLMEPDGATNDPFLGSQWHLSTIGALAAWDRSSGSGVTIAVLDTGVDAQHPDLVNNLVAGWNFYSNTADTSDAFNHGTGVAGSAAATMNNALGVAGVSGLTRIMPIRIAADTGTASWSAAAQGLTYAADRGVRVANISYSGAARSASVVSAAQYMKDRGGLVFVSAGNTGTTSTGTPVSSMIIVSATTSSDTLASWSTYGSPISLSAPGAGVYTTTKGGGYVSENGTSFASPVAAGVAALVWAANPGLSSSQVEGILFATAVDLGAAGRDDFFGHGRVNAAAAVERALATAAAPAADTQAPRAAILAPLAGSTVAGLVAVTPEVSDNVGVTRVELLVNGSVVATDSTLPFGFSWDSTRVGNGSASLAVVAYDAAGNRGSSAAASVNVANAVAADTTPPVVRITSPANGTRVAAGNVKVSTSATDDRGNAGLQQTLFINGKQVATATGGALSYTWNTRKLSAGTYTLRAVARDAAGNVGETVSTVSR
jgi:subtilisin family serine protease